MRTILASGVILGLLLPFTAGCAGEGTAATGLKAAIDTVGSIERLHYPETGATELPWRFDTVAVIGGFTEDDPDKQFGQVFRHGLASDAAGNLYVFDNQGKRIIGFSTAGDVIGTWGREGEGPGEIGAWGGVLAMGPGDTLWLADSSNQRITLFPTDGGEPASIPAPEGSASFGGKMVVVPDGVLSMMTSFSFSPDSDTKMPDRPLVHVTRDGTVTDTLWSVPAAEVDLVTITSGDHMMMLMMSRRFSPNFSYDRFSDGGFVKHDQVPYDFRLIASDGTVERIIQRDPAPRPTTDEDRQRVIDELLDPRDGEVSDTQKKQAEATTFSDVIPLINTLILDHADRIWVGVSETVPGENERLDIYSRDGRLLGELHDVELPHLFFGDGYAALITEDELDVQQIVILRLVEST